MIHVNQHVKARVCLAYSPGGHYTELIKAIEGISFPNSYHVTFTSGRVNHTSDKIYRLTHPQKKILNTLKNIYESFLVLWKERPKVIISTGADVAVPTLILGKLFFSAKIIFVESGGDISPTLSGRLVYPFSDLFIVQWESQLADYPKAILSDGLLL